MSYFSPAANEWLMRRYPFIVPRNFFTGQIVEFPRAKDMYTKIDLLPVGWRRAFAVKLCEEIRQELIKQDNLYGYCILEIKEKYGVLRLVGASAKDVSKITNEIIPRYERISRHTCAKCGAIASKVSLGWISPYCDKCANKLKDIETFTDVDKW